MDLSSCNNNLAVQLHKLCVGLTSDPDSAYELAVSYLSLTPEKSCPQQDEKVLCQRVYSRLASSSVRDADKFNECYTKLKQSFVLKQRVSILTLLLALSDTPKTSDSTHQLFPVPLLATVKSLSGSGGTQSSSSKGTLGSAGWDDARRQPSAHSFTSKNSNMALALNAQSDHNTISRSRSAVRSAVLAATGVRSRGAEALPRPARALHQRIAHLGLLHDRLREFIDPASGLMPQGLMGEGLVTAIRDELTEYHRSIALLQSQALDGEGGAGGAAVCTLRRVAVWALEPLHRLTWLANIAHVAHLKKGGELASCVHRFAVHGDSRVAALARRLLTALTYPLLLMLTRWLLHGEIDDPFNEFFIECRSGVPIDRLWHDKYRVREWMVPSFIGGSLSAQILATGKSVVFMREAGGDAASDHHHHLAALQRHARPPHAPPGLYGSTAAGPTEPAWWETTQLQTGVALSHSAVSAQLVAALRTHHSLLDHLAAHRRYLLLHQGDFVHHLMTLLQDELSKPASALYVHNLSSTLEAAVRATNAQFEPPHVLERLHVNLFPNCDGREDSGWDVFALQYRADGPLGTLFPGAVAARYRALFAQLWRVKRIEHALHDAWRHHTLLHKRLRRMPEVWPLMRRVSCMRLEALRLCGALQEASCVGAEPAWRDLTAAAADGRGLDVLLDLHRKALDRHAIHAMIHHSTQELQLYLGNVLSEILTLREFEAALHAGVSSEVARRDDMERLREERLAKGEYAYTSAEEALDKERRKMFLQFLAKRRADLNVLARSYRSHVSTLIRKLSDHFEVSLQTLAFRLDYSDFYKCSDPKLHQLLTYQHKRLSEIGLDDKKKERTRRK